MPRFDIRSSLCALLGAFLLASCGGELPTGSVEVLERLPHDPEAYTQGLLFEDGVLYESTGKYGESDVRRFDGREGPYAMTTHTTGGSDS